jgi:hypothetical protein
VNRHQHGNVGGPSHVSVSPPPRPVPPLAALATPPTARPNDSVSLAGPARAVGAWRMRPGTRASGSAGTRGARCRGRGVIERGGQVAGTGRPGGGSAASPSAARSRRTAWGSVTAPRIRRGPPQRGHTRTSNPNTRWSNRAQGHRRGTPASASARAASEAAFWTIAARHRDREAVTFYRESETGHRSLPLAPAVRPDGPWCTFVLDCGTACTVPVGIFGSGARPSDAS